MASTIKVNNIQNQCGANIVNKCSTTITLGASGDNITLACGATQTGFGRTGTVDWDTTAKTANFTAVSGNGYFVNTTSGAITVTLPAGSAGSIVSLKDYANTWNTNNVTVTPNGTDKINGAGGNAILSTQDQSVTLVYVDSTKGWRVVQDSTSAVDGAQYVAATGGTITTCGDYKIHTFTSPGTFCVSSAGNPAGSNTVDYLVVAGGGSGGTRSPGNANGGGGAGGFRYSATTFCAAGPGAPLASCSALPVSATGYPVTVGAGASAPSPSSSGIDGSQGSNSVFSTITSTGGGGGGSGQSSRPGLPGGSGGGGGGGAPGGNPGGTGNSPPVSPAQGTNGGNALGGTPDAAAAAGGGALVAGTNSSPPGTGPQAPAGGAGAGIPTAFGCNGRANPSPDAYRYYAGGGGAGGLAAVGQGSGGSGGLGGGGQGGNNAGAFPGSYGDPGFANTGGGGGGGNASPCTGCAAGGAGGSGIVVIRYKFQ